MRVGDIFSNHSKSVLLITEDKGDNTFTYTVLRDGLDVSNSLGEVGEGYSLDEQAFKAAKYFFVINILDALREHDARR